MIYKDAHRGFDAHPIFSDKSRRRMPLHPGSLTIFYINNEWK